MFRRRKGLPGVLLPPSPAPDTDSRPPAAEDCPGVRPPPSNPRPLADRADRPVSRGVVPPAGWPGAGGGWETERW